MQAMTTVALTPTAHSPKRLPGDLAIWFFILAEMLAFAVFFPPTPSPGPDMPRCSTSTSKRWIETWAR
jgi:hypothetical protein